MKATTMLRLFAVLVTGGFGLALALDATLNGYTPTAALFTTASMVLMLFGWFDLRDSTATKAHADVLRDNIDTLIKMNGKRAADASLYVQALVNARSGLHDGMGRQALMEMIDDALAEFHDPATAAQFCIEWLKDMGVPPIVAMPTRPADDEASQFDDEMFNRGVSHTVDLLAKTIGAEGWVHGDGSEDYDSDLAQTFMNILKAKGLYEDEHGTWATLPATLDGKAL